jgi:hypothetical protein
MTDNEISAMKKETFKDIVKPKVRAAAFLYLKEIQKKHSKVKTIKQAGLSRATLKIFSRTSYEFWSSSF